MQKSKGCPTDKTGNIKKSHSVHLLKNQLLQSLAQKMLLLLNIFFTSGIFQQGFFHIFPLNFKIQRVASSIFFEPIFFAYSFKRGTFKICRFCKRKLSSK